MRLPFVAFVGLLLLPNCINAVQKPRTVLQRANKTFKKEKPKKNTFRSFGLPALGIFVTGPLLSNLDNVVVGRTVGSVGLAALSPASVCTDQVLFLFSFLARACVGLVSRAYGKSGDTKASKEAATTPFTVAVVCGILLSVMYVTIGPRLLPANLEDSVRSQAQGYVFWKGGMTLLTLPQFILLPIFLATGDAMTPFRIVASLALMNVLGDVLFCVHPFQKGCVGIAMSTACATVAGTLWMSLALAKRNLMPSVRLPTRKQAIQLLEYTGPLFAITLIKLYGYISMQQAAMRLGVDSLAAYQLVIGILVFFFLCGEPLATLAQTKIPPLLDDWKELRTAYRSIVTSAFQVGLLVSILAGAAIYVGGSLFTSDEMVLSLTEKAPLPVAIAVLTNIVSGTVDGAMLGAKDFGYLLWLGLLSTIVQVICLLYCRSLGDILFVSSIRLLLNIVTAELRLRWGFGPLGSAMKTK